MVNVGTRMQHMHTHVYEIYITDTHMRHNYIADTLHCKSIKIVYANY